MYESYWNFHRKPFDAADETESFFRSDTHLAALLKLQYAVENRHAAALLLGNAGTGKTFILRRFVEELTETTAVVHVKFPQLSATELLAYVSAELGAGNVPAGRDHLTFDRVVRNVERQFHSLAQHDRRPVVIVDDAHLIDDPRVFQALRLLLNLQRGPHPDVCLILAGQQKLGEQLAGSSSLADRISVRAVVASLTREETARYVFHRVSAAGGSRACFDAGALQALFDITHGSPRRIDQLSDLALLVGFAEGANTVTAAVIESVAEELLGLEV